MHRKPHLVSMVGLEKILPEVLGSWHQLQEIHMTGRKGPVIQYKAISCIQSVGPEDR